MASVADPNVDYGNTQKKRYGNTYYLRPDSNVPNPGKQTSTIKGGRELYRPTPTKSRPSKGSQAQRPSAPKKSSQVVTKSDTNLPSNDPNLEERPVIFSPRFDQGGSGTGAVVPEDIPDDGRSPLPSWGVRLQKLTVNGMGTPTPLVTQPSTQGITPGPATVKSPEPESIRTATVVHEPSEPTPVESLQKTEDTRSVAPSIPSRHPLVPIGYQANNQPPQQQRQTLSDYDRSFGSMDYINDSLFWSNGGSDVADEYAYDNRRRPPENQWRDPNEPDPERFERVETPPGIRGDYSMSGRSFDQAGKPLPLNYQASTIRVPDGPSLVEKRNEYQAYHGSADGVEWRNLLGKEMVKQRYTATIMTGSQLSPVPEVLTPVNGQPVTPVTATPEGLSEAPSVPLMSIRTPSEAPSVPSARTITPEMPKTPQSGFDILGMSQPVSQKTVKGVKETSYPWIDSMYYENVVPFAYDPIKANQHPTPEEPEPPVGVYPRMLIETEEKRPKKDVHVPDPSLNLKTTRKHLWDNRKGKYWDQEYLESEEFDLRNANQPWIPGHKHYHTGIDVNSARFGGSQMSVWPRIDSGATDSQYSGTHVDTASIRDAASPRPNYTSQSRVSRRQLTPVTRDANRTPYSQPVGGGTEQQTRGASRVTQGRRQRTHASNPNMLQVPPSRSHYSQQGGGNRTGTVDALGTTRDRATRGTGTPRGTAQDPPANGGHGTAAGNQGARGGQRLSPIQSRGQASGAGSYRQPPGSTQPQSRKQTVQGNPQQSKANTALPQGSGMQSARDKTSEQPGQPTGTRGTIVEPKDSADDQSVVSHTRRQMSVGEPGPATTGVTQSKDTAPQKKSGASVQRPQMSTGTRTVGKTTASKLAPIPDQG